jgi:8-oxo-dGTP diphosphatase
VRNVTLCFLVEEDRVNLGTKKRGFGVGKPNGYGGKPKEGEDLIACALRELSEEAYVKAHPEDVEKVGEIEFYFSAKSEWNQRVHIYLIRKWVGEPSESEEMLPVWYNHSEIPYSQMWSDDKHWLPLILNGEKVKGSFTFGDDHETIIEYQLEQNL